MFISRVCAGTAHPTSPKFSRWNAAPVSSELSGHRMEWHSSSRHSGEYYLKSSCAVAQPGLCLKAQAVARTTAFSALLLCSDDTKQQGTAWNVNRSRSDAYLPQCLATTSVGQHAHSMQARPLSCMSCTINFGSAIHIKGLPDTACHTFRCSYPSPRSPSPCRYHHVQATSPS